MASAVVYSCRVPIVSLGETCIHLIGNEGPHDLVVARGRLVGFVEVIAYHASLKGKPAPAEDGFSDDQRFFLANAQARRAKQRDDVLATSSRRTRTRPRSSA